MSGAIEKVTCPKCGNADAQLVESEVWIRSDRKKWKKEITCDNCSYMKWSMGFK